MKWLYGKPQNTWSFKKEKLKCWKKKQEINQENKKVLSNTMYRTERISIEHPWPHSSPVHTTPLQTLQGALIQK